MGGVLTQGRNFQGIPGLVSGTPKYIALSRVYDILPEDFILSIYANDDAGAIRLPNPLDTPHRVIIILGSVALGGGNVVVDASTNNGRMNLDSSIATLYNNPLGETEMLILVSDANQTKWGAVSSGGWVFS